MPTTLRPLNRPRHWNARPRKVRVWLRGDGSEVCPFCCTRTETCGVLCAGLPCGREPGHLGDHGACVGRAHAKHWKHQPKRRTP